MATWIEVNLNLEKLDKSQVKKLDNGTFYRVLVKVVDEYQYGKNAYAITSYPEDAKPEKEHKVGNGRVVFTTGTIEKAVDTERVNNAPVQPEPVAAEDDIDLPF
jgi:hypothetical protein